MREGEKESTNCLANSSISQCVCWSRTLTTDTSSWNGTETSACLHNNIQRLTSKHLQTVQRSNTCTVHVVLLSMCDCKTLLTYCHSAVVVIVNIRQPSAETHQSHNFIIKEFTHTQCTVHLL